jgi:HPt (histidine-containing phosphotransfer) domain-containing protein
MALETFIDFDMGKVYLGRDHDSFLKRFVEVDLQEYLEKMKNFLENADLEELHRTADTLASTCCYVGAKHCQELSKKVSLSAKERKMKKLEGEMIELVSHGKILQKLIKVHFDEKVVSATSANLDRITSSTLEENSEYRSYRLRPPQKKPTPKQQTWYEDDFDPFEDNKQWTCEIF